MHIISTLWNNARYHPAILNPVMLRSYHTTFYWFAYMEWVKQLNQKNSDNTHTHKTFIHKHFSELCFHRHILHILLDWIELYSVKFKMLPWRRLESFSIFTLLRMRWYDLCATRNDAKPRQCCERESKRLKKNSRREEWSEITRWGKKKYERTKKIWNENKGEEKAVRCKNLT